MKRIKVLTVGHSFVVEANRAVMNTVNQFDDVEVTIVSPDKMKSEMGEIIAIPGPNVVIVPTYLSQRIHLFFYTKIEKLLKSGNYDLIYIWEEPYIYSGFQIARLAKKYKIPYVFSTFQNINKKYPFPFSFIENYVSKNSSGWIPHANLVKETLLSRGYSERNCKLITMGVSKNRFFPEEAKRTIKRGELGLTKVTLCFMGRLIEDKGISVLIQALGQVNFDWQLLVLGVGPEKETIVEWARNINKIHDVKFIHAKHDLVPDYLRCADILVAPSQTTGKWKEQFGRMIIEAFASKVAVIGSTSGEIPHVIGDCGIIVDEKNVTEWKEKIEFLLKENVKREELAKAGLDRFLENFESLKIAEKYRSFFHKILDSDK
jgi:glycosyltransferase involved in cell wall biosynthesis